MFAKIFKVLAAAAIVGSAVATPLPNDSDSLIARGSSHSFNNWGGLSSLSGFDNFYGSNDFSGSSFSEHVEEDSKVVCHSESVTIIQQRLLVLQEMAKRIITEQICDVETQVIVFEQFSSSMSSFSHDLTRSSGSHGVGYDSAIAGHYGSIVSSDGSLSNSNLGFSGSSLGQSYVIPTGSNWNSRSSPASVGRAYQAAQAAI
jgi:hypothetical protein